MSPNDLILFLAIILIGGFTLAGIAWYAKELYLYIRDEIALWRSKR